MMSNEIVFAKIVPTAAAPRVALSAGCGPKGRN
jgi:hypothetical protein